MSSRSSRRSLDTKQWWTVFAVYDDNEQPYIEYVEAKDKTDARSKALRKAESVILIAGIAPGKIENASVEDLDNVVPIRGKGHAIHVSHVRVTKREIVIPGRCPGCKKDLRRAGAMSEKFLSAQHWAGHLSHNGKDFVAERDMIQRRGAHATYDIVELQCSDCRHMIWEGLHDDE